MEIANALDANIKVLEERFAQEITILIPNGSFSSEGELASSTASFFTPHAAQSSRISEMTKMKTSRVRSSVREKLWNHSLMKSHSWDGSIENSQHRVSTENINIA